MSVIKVCPFCRGNRIGCDYCDESGLMDLNEIARANQDIESCYMNDADMYYDVDEDDE